MKIDESARGTTSNGKVLCIYNCGNIEEKDMPNRKQTLKPRPNNRVGTNELHSICHGNPGSFDDLPIPQFKPWKTRSHPNWLVLRGFFVYHDNPSLAHPSRTNETFIDVTKGNFFQRWPLRLTHASLPSF